MTHLSPSTPSPSAPSAPSNGRVADCYAPMECVSLRLTPRPSPALMLATGLLRDGSKGTLRDKARLLAVLTAASYGAGEGLTGAALKALFEELDAVRTCSCSLPCMTPYIDTFLMTLARYQLNSLSSIFARAADSPYDL